jgi:signal transduction histidine kinase
MDGASRQPLRSVVDRMRLAPGNLRPASSIRGVLVAGFTVVFAVWAFAGYELIRSVNNVERQVVEAHLSFTNVNDILSVIRKNVFTSSIYVRDVLIDGTPVAREEYREELRKLRSEADERLRRDAEMLAQSSERQQWQRLESQLDHYWESLDFVLDPLPLNIFDSTTILRRDILPARQDVFRVIDELKGLQAMSQAEHDVRVAALYRDVRERSLWIVAGALAMGIAVAWFAFWHVGRLEGELHRQRLAETETRHELERLSARLVDAQEEERRNLARELHDEVGQALTAIKMDVGVASRSAGIEARGRAALEDARAIAETALQNVRDVSQLLHPSMLDDFGLPETLAAYLRSFSKRTGIRAQLTHQGLDTRLPAEVEVCVYRIVQEALTNVARHSGALSCSVKVTRQGESVQLLIEDTGRGLAGAKGETADARRGLGLIGMRERAQALAGRFSIDNRPEGGTAIAVWLPVPPVEAAERLAG